MIFRDESEPEMIVDTAAEKPDGWLDDEPHHIPDPSAEKPADWYSNLLLCVTHHLTFLFILCK